jgi:hypothetical protein
MASPTIAAAALPQNEDARKSTQPKQRRSWPKWVLPVRHHPWRVLGVAVLVAAAVFLVHTVTEGGSPTENTVEAQCVQNYQGSFENGADNVNLHGTNLNTDCTMVAECYVQHLSGISESQYVTAESPATTRDRSETDDLNSADNECQKALPSLASLVDNTNPAGLTNTSNLGS